MFTRGYFFRFWSIPPDRQPRWQRVPDPFQLRHNGSWQGPDSRSIQQHTGITKQKGSLSICPICSIDVPFMLVIERIPLVLQDINWMISVRLFLFRVLSEKGILSSNHFLVKSSKRNPGDEHSFHSLGRTYDWIYLKLEGSYYELPSGKHTKNYGKSQFFMGKSTMSMAMFNSYVKLPEGIVLFFLDDIILISGWSQHCFWLKVQFVSWLCLRVWPWFVVKSSFCLVKWLNLA